MEMISPPPQICKFFISGYCRSGDRCPYLHSDPNVINHRHRVPPVSASSYQGLAIENCRGEIFSMCRDQHGCRFLQKLLETGDDRVVKVIFEEVYENIVDLMSDPFGNYLCQKLLEYCNAEQRTAIVQGAAQEFVSISKNIHGTRAIQKLIELINTPEEYRIIRDSLKGSVVGLIQDLNGNHVIQKCLHKMEPNDNQFIYDAVARHCVQVATHRHGCCVMQRCIDHGTEQQKKQLIEEVRRNSQQLVQDPFGNYVVQYVLELNMIPELATNIIIELKGNLAYLSKQKFSSNVVEKCLKLGDAECTVRIMRELLGEDPDIKFTTILPIVPEDIKRKLFELMQDSFGNYVIQTCLSEGAFKAPREYAELSNILKNYLSQIRNAPYSKRIQHLLNLNQ